MDSEPTINLEHIGWRTYVRGKIKSFISDNLVLDMPMEHPGVNDQVEKWIGGLGG